MVNIASNNFSDNNEPSGEEQFETIVSTDKLDYAPGETAVITGSGFTPGSEVVIQIADRGI